MRAPVLVLLLCGALVSCATEPAVPTRAQETAYDDELPPLGEPVVYYFYAHCGVEHVRLGGRWWHATEGAQGDVEGHADYERGTLTVLSPTRAVFEGDDLRVGLEPGPPPDDLCR